MAYKFRRGYSASGTFNTTMDYAYESNGRTYRVFKGHNLRFVRGNSLGSRGYPIPRRVIVGDYGPPLPPDYNGTGVLSNYDTSQGNILPSQTNAKYRDVAAAGRIVFMMILMLAYFNIVFGDGIEKSPFYIGLDIAQSIADRGASVKTAFMDDFKVFVHDLHNLRRFSFDNWGEDVSFLEFLDMCWSGLKAPFTFINFLISLMENMLEIVLGALDVLFGLI